MFKKIISLLFIMCVVMLFGVSSFAQELPTEVVSEISTEIATDTVVHVPTFDSAMRYEMIFLLVIVALCYFETILTGKDNKYLGLIIPVASFVAMTAMTFIYAFDAEAFSLIGFIFTLILLNIPTMILLLIYHFGRKKYEKESNK